MSRIHTRVWYKHPPTRYRGDGDEPGAHDFQTVSTICFGLLRTPIQHILGNSKLWPEELCQSFARLRYRWPTPAFASNGPLRYPWPTPAFASNGPLRYPWPTPAFASNGLLRYPWPMPAFASNGHLRYPWPTACRFGKQGVQRLGSLYVVRARKRQGAAAAAAAATSIMYTSKWRQQQQ